jgi:hypothetical protein
MGARVVEIDSCEFRSRFTYGHGYGIAVTVRCAPLIKSASGTYSMDSNLFSFSYIRSHALTALYTALYYAQKPQISGTISARVY